MNDQNTKTKEETSEPPSGGAGLSAASCSVFSRNVLEMTESFLALAPSPALEEWLDEEWEVIARAQKDGIYRFLPNAQGQPTRANGSPNG